MTLGKFLPSFPLASQVFLGSLSLFTGFLGVADGLCAVLRKPEISKFLSIPHTILLGCVIGCVLGGYIYSGVWWANFFNNCGFDPCGDYTRTNAAYRLAVSGFLFLVFSTINFIFTLLFMLNVRAGEDETILDQFQSTQQVQAV